jgi:hypothetical protein
MLKICVDIKITSRVDEFNEPRSPDSFSHPFVPPISHLHDIRFRQRKKIQPANVKGGGGGDFIRLPFHQEMA